MNAQFFDNNMFDRIAQNEMKSTMRMHAMKLEKTYKANKANVHC